MKTLFRPEYFVLTLLSIALPALCASLIQFDPVQGWIARSYALWGDWSAHLSLISAFRERGISWIAGANPLFSDAPFQYPFISHAYTALVAWLFGLGVMKATLYLSLILLFAFPIVLFRFYRAFTLTPRAALYATLGFLLMGGFQFLDSNLKPELPITNQFDAGSVFTQFVLFEFIPQRAFLFGTTFMLLILTWMIQTRTQSRTLWSGALIKLSFLPLIHFHSYFALGALLLFLLAFPLPHSPRFAERKPILITGGILLFISSALASLVLLRHSNHPYRWDLWLPGWAQNPDANLDGASAMNPLWFWLYNTGLFLPLVGVGVLISRKAPAFRAFLATGLTLFGVGLLFRIQPYFYDNLKIFTWSFLFLAPFLGLALEAIHQKFWPIAIALAVFQSASAIRDFHYFWGGSQHAIFFDPLELNLAREFKKIRHSPDDLVLIQPRHNHWVPCLSGNPIVMGYPGWMWSWGISYQSTEQKLTEVLTGGPRALADLDSLHVKWIVLDEREKVQNQDVNFQFFESHFKKILEAGPWRIYSIESITKSPS